MMRLPGPSSGTQIELPGGRVPRPSCGTLHLARPGKGRESATRADPGTGRTRDGPPRGVRQHADRLLLPLDPLRNVIRMTPGLIDFVEQPQPLAIFPQPIPRSARSGVPHLPSPHRPSASVCAPTRSRIEPRESLKRTGHVVVCRVVTRRELESPGHVLMLCTEEPPLEHRHTVCRVRRPC